MKSLVLASLLALATTPALAAEAPKAPAPAKAKKTLALNCQVTTKAGKKTVHAKNEQTCAKRKGTWVAAPATVTTSAKAPAAAPKK